MLVPRHWIHASRWDQDIITIPSHSSHHMQLYDVSCFKHSKQYLEDDKTTMTLESPNWGNGVLLKITLPKMTANALNKVLKPSNIISCFKTTCITQFFL